MVINKYEYQVFAMQRSGHHAIINWLRGLHGGSAPSLFVNDFSRLKRPRQQFEFYNFNDKAASAELAGDFSKKELLIINFEETNPAMADKMLSGSEYYPRGLSDVTKKFLVLRDPYNMFASRLKKSRQEAKQTFDRWCGEKALALWVHHAELFQGKNEFIPVNYNLWVESKKYRDNLAVTIGMENRDLFRDVVPKYGGGSSFDRMARPAEDMDVLNRWRAFSGESCFESIFSSRVRAESRKIFGKIK